MAQKRENERETRVTRADIGSWISGPPQTHNSEYPGAGLGRPESGPGSVGRMGPRILALLIDWGLAMGVSWLITRDVLPWLNLVAFAVMTLVMLTIFGRTIGHWILGLQVQRLDGSPISPLDALIRTVLLLLVVPPVVMDADQRGVHDRLRGLVLTVVRGGASGRIVRK